MSSAILYLAIVAIWAVVLVPRWLRPRPPVPVPVEQVTEQPADHPTDETGAAQRDHLATAGTMPSPEAILAGTGPGSDVADPGRYVADPGLTGAHAGAAQEPDVANAAKEGKPQRPPRRSPAERRADVLRARRRMLAMLIALTAGAVALAASGLAASWVIIPPALLLTGLLVLLREAARSDAERTFDAERMRRATLAREAPLSRAAEQEQAAAGQDTTAGEDAAAGEEQAPARTATADLTGPLDFDTSAGAEVIDISGRISDQVYDQYSDAADRAVGD